MATLVILVAEAGVGSRFPLREGELLIGRAEDAGICLKDTKASLRHCSIHVHGGTIVLKDLGARNGTYVNGISRKETPLSIGDRIVVGATVFELRKDSK